MKILYISTGRYPTERAYGIQIDKTIQALRELGAEVEVKSPWPPLQKLLFFGKFGFILRTLIFSNYIKFVWLFGKYDCIYTRDPLIVWELSFVRARVFLELHDISASRWILRQATKYAKGVVVISNGLRDELISRGVEKSKILIARDAVDLDKFIISLDKWEARTSFGLPLDKKIVLYAGMFDEWKGYKTLLEASRLFTPTVVLVMAGGRLKEVGKLKSAYPNVIFLGWTDYDKLPILLKVADVLVLPNSAKFEISRLYTSPLKLFAYMASGVPIVASDLPSIREIVDNEIAVLVEPDNSGAIAGGVEKILQDTVLAKRISEKAKSLVKNYTWSNRAKTILDFISLRIQ